jgi:hypothetical protein
MEEILLDIVPCKHPDDCNTEGDYTYIETNEDYYRIASVPYDMKLEIGELFDVDKLGKWNNYEIIEADDFYRAKYVAGDNKSAEQIVDDLKQKVIDIKKCTGKYGQFRDLMKMLGCIKYDVCKIENAIDKKLQKSTIRAHVMDLAADCMEVAEYLSKHSADDLDKSLTN